MTSAGEFEVSHEELLNYIMTFGTDVAKLDSMTWTMREIICLSPELDDVVMPRMQYKGNLVGQTMWLTLVLERVFIHVRVLSWPFCLDVQEAIQSVSESELNIDKVTKDQLSNYLCELGENTDKIDRVADTIKSMCRLNPRLQTLVLPRPYGTKRNIFGMSIWLGKTLDLIFAVVDTLRWPYSLVIRNRTGKMCKNRKTSDMSDAGKNKLSDMSDRVTDMSVTVTDMSVTRPDMSGQNRSNFEPPTTPANEQVTNGSTEIKMVASARLPLDNYDRRPLCDNTAYDNRGKPVMSNSVSDGPRLLSTTEMFVSVLAEQQNKLMLDKKISLTSGQYDKFDGSDTTLFSTWLDSVKLRVSATNVSDDWALVHLKHCLAGTALYNYLLLPAHILSNWSLSVQELERRYLDKNRDQKIAQQFYTRNQLPEESVHAYANVLRSMCRTAESDVSYNVQMLHVFKTGLKSKEFKQKANLAMSRNTPFDELVLDLVAREESNERLKMCSNPGDMNGNQHGSCYNGEMCNQISQSENDMWCAYCKKNTDHEINKCPRRAYVNIQGKMQPRCYGCNGIGHKKNQCPQKECDRENSK